MCDVKLTLLYTVTVPASCIRIFVSKSTTRNLDRVKQEMLNLSKKSFLAIFIDQLIKITNNNTLKVFKTWYKYFDINFFEHPFNIIIITKLEDLLLYELNDNSLIIFDNLKDFKNLSFIETLSTLCDRKDDLVLKIKGKKIKIPKSCLFSFLFTCDKQYCFKENCLGIFCLDSKCSVKNDNLFENFILMTKARESIRNKIVLINVQ